MEGDISQTKGGKLKPKYKIGDIVKPSNCSSEYQKNNMMVVNYIEKFRSDFINDDGESDYMEWFSYSENGTGFYPENTIIIEEEGGQKCT